MEGWRSVQKCNMMAWIRHVGQDKLDEGVRALANEHKASPANKSEIQSQVFRNQKFKQLVTTRKCITCLIPLTKSTIQSTNVMCKLKEFPVQCQASIWFKFVFFILGYTKIVKNTQIFNFNCNCGDGVGRGGFNLSCPEKKTKKIQEVKLFFIMSFLCLK